ncbi:MAG: M56 family metallopeptidase [Planctomycetota bacterium]
MVLPWAPSSRVSLFNLIPSWDRQAQPQQRSEITEQHEPSEAARTSGTTETIPAQRPESSVTVQEQATAKPTTPADTRSESRRRLASLRPVLPALWLGGAMVIGAYLLMSDFALWRIVKRNRPLLNQAMLELFEECKAQMGVQSLVVVVPSDQVRSPGLFGFVRPRLLLPREMLDTATREEMRYVFLHELAHLKRHDIYLGWLTSLLQVLHWFNPLVWFAFHRMRTDRELACDALVLTQTGQDKSQEYGGVILGLVRRFSRSRPLPAMAGIMESRSQLKRRIAMITQFKNNSYRWSPLAAVLIVILACISVPDAQRTRASATAAAMQEPTLRRIEVLTHSPRRIHSSPSLDGKYMATTTHKGKLVVSESATGKKWNLTEQGGVAGVGILPLISPDNTKIVYLWSTFEKRTWEVRVVAFDGSDDRLLSSEWIDFDTWSPDGQFLFGRHARPDKDNSTWLMKMSVDDGSMQYIDIVDAKGLSKVDVSSDGRFLAYHRIDKTTSKSDIFIFDLLENRESILVRDPADDKLLGWTPDGQHIFFTSDRMGTSDGWLLAVQQGKPKGLPRMIKPGLGDLVPIRLTRDGSLYYTVQYNAWNVYTVELDVAAGKAMSEPKAVRDMGKDGSPDWSPDGRYLAYCSEPDQSKPQVIRIRTLATGEERELKPDLPHFKYLRWHPDSRHLLAPYLKSAGLAGVSQIDIQTGQCRDLLTAPVVGSERIRQAEMSADGKTLAYRIRKGNGNRLIVKDMETGREKVLLSTENTVQNPMHGGNSWALLPEGKQVALSFLDGASHQLKTMSVADKTTRTIVSSFFGQLTCINDGRDLLFVRGKGDKELWRVSTAGSEPQKVWECEQLIINPRLHPDGRHLAFVSGTFISEMWVMENFLPEELGK